MPETILGVTVVALTETGVADGDSFVGMSELTFGCSVVMAEVSNFVEGDCIVGIVVPELTTGISLSWAIGTEAMDGDGIVGTSVSRLCFSLDVGTEPDEGNCISGTTVGPEVGSAVVETVCARLGMGLGSTVGSELAIIVGEPLGLRDGMALLWIDGMLEGVAVELDVDDKVGNAVGAWFGSKEGLSVATAVGETAEDGLGDGNSLCPPERRNHTLRRNDAVRH